MKKKSNIINSHILGFEDIKKIDENGVEFWSARDLFPLMGYSTWQKFEEVIGRAKKTAFVSGQEINDQFNQLVKLIEAGKGAKRNLVDYKLSRYACYLIAQNGDSRIQQIALAQTYFAIQTRKQEVQDLERLNNLEKRIFIRGEVTKENKKLFSTARKSGVNNFGQFNDAGYRGLYGLPLVEIEKRKNIKKGQLLDRAGSAELAANLFRITQTEEKLSLDKVKTQYQANTVHNMIGGKIRQTIKDIQGVLPENMKPVVHIKDVKKEVKLLGKSKKKK